MYNIGLGTVKDRHSILLNQMRFTEWHFWQLDEWRSRVRQHMHKLVGFLGTVQQAWAGVLVHFCTWRTWLKDKNFDIEGRPGHTQNMVSTFNHTIGRKSIDMNQRARPFRVCFNQVNWETMPGWKSAILRHLLSSGGLANWVREIPPVNSYGCGGKMLIIFL